MAKFEQPSLLVGGKIVYDLATRTIVQGDRTCVAQRQSDGSVAYFNERDGGSAKDITGTAPAFATTQVASTPLPTVTRRRGWGGV